MKGVCAMRRQRTQAFTLIELLVVIAIIAMLMSIMMPSLQQAKERSRRVVCQANLHAIGQAIFIYGNQNNDRLIPGDSWEPWDVWGCPREYSGIPLSPEGGNRRVNLGHLLGNNRIIPMPSDDEHTYFCPSSRKLGTIKLYDSFVAGWNTLEGSAPISYMFNTALDGFDGHVESCETTVLAHGNRINFLTGDGAAQVFKGKPLVFDDSEGSELLQEVSLRYGISFPPVLLHEWFSLGSVDLDEAKAFLADPQGWSDSNCDLTSANFVQLSSLGRTSLVSDALVWSGTMMDPG
jgi:prepilin-type N-terminal cleavage/methylation domain-containing protein